MVSCFDFKKKSMVLAHVLPVVIKKSGPLAVLINEEVLRGMNLEEPTILFDTTGIFMS
jgi:hypothetical protein